jgi:hypothetical protein
MLLAVLLQQRQSMALWIVDVDLVIHDGAGDAELLPPFQCPKRLAEVLARQMRPAGVVLAPSSRLLSIWRVQQDALQLLVFQCCLAQPSLGYRRVREQRLLQHRCRFGVVVERSEAEEQDGNQASDEDYATEECGAYEAQSMVWVAVAVGPDVYVLDERRAFVGHAGDGLLISCEKLHIQTNKKTKHLLQCLRYLVDVGKLQTATRPAWLHSVIGSGANAECELTLGVQGAAGPPISPRTRGTHTSCQHLISTTWSLRTNVQQETSSLNHHSSSHAHTALPPSLRAGDLPASHPDTLISFSSISLAHNSPRDARARCGDL